MMCYPTRKSFYRGIRQTEFVRILKNLRKPKNRSLYLDMAVDYEELPGNLCNGSITLVIHHKK